MGTPAFPNLGKRCSVDDCRQIDFFPFTCDCCRQKHCAFDYFLHLNLSLHLNVDGSLEELVYSRQDSKEFQGELFGISNLFLDLSDMIFTSDIIGKEHNPNNCHIVKLDLDELGMFSEKKQYPHIL